MNCTTPRYLLFSRADRHGGSGSWQFAFRSPDGGEPFEAADVEPKIRGDRLDLLTVVRALESLDQPSQVTLVGSSRYIREGLAHGLVQWRENGWRWEFFGDMVPVKNGDLWQRLDRALRFYRVECDRHRLDLSHETPELPIRPSLSAADVEPSMPTLVGTEENTAENTAENRREDVELGIRVADHNGIRYEESSASGDSRRLAGLIRRPAQCIVRWWAALVSTAWADRNRGARYLGKTG